jgi:hypothetical protein
MINSYFGWKGKDEFVENTQKKSAIVHRNGEFEQGKGKY